MTFVAHTKESAPEASRRALAAAEHQFGFIPDALARLAEAPVLVEAFAKATAAFDRTGFDAVEREIIILTLAAEVGCEVCIALHARMLAADGHAAIGQALVEGRPLADPRHAALARFTQRVLATRGAVADEDLAAFGGAGYTARAALEVVVGIGAYTLTTFGNRLTRAHVDPALRG